MESQAISLGLHFTQVQHNVLEINKDELHILAVTLRWDPALAIMQVVLEALYNLSTDKRTVFCLSLKIKKNKPNFL